ncbi:MAG: hypothetical protein WB622_02430 [Acidobacteriaceae bacterium]
MASALRVRREERDRVLSLEVLAREAKTEPREEPTQFRVLARHFLERFFTNEMASADGDAKTRLVQVACALGIPGLIVAMYLYPVYHLPRGHVGRFWGPRPYWSQAGDHYFYVVYSLVALGLVTIFEWDLLFPDLLDVFVMGHLPVSNRRVFAARVTAIAVLLGAALFDVNFLAPLVLPAATDPPHLFRFWAAHLTAVGASGLFGAALFLALEGVLLGVLGDRWFRKISMWLQGGFVVALLTLLFLYPAMAGSLQGLTAGRLAIGVPSFWFLGIYEQVLHGSTTLPVFVRLARVGWAATFAAVSVAVALYPLAWWRRTRGLVEGAAKKERRSVAAHMTLARTPIARAMGQFIRQNLMRVPRYRMVLVMYGGMGAALVFATVMRVSTAGGRIAFVFSPEGLRAVVPMVAFWAVSGLRSTFLAPADQRGRWIFRVTVGKAGLAEVGAARRWTLLWSAALTLAAVVLSAWTEYWTDAVLGTQILVAMGWSVVLTDVFFLNVKTIPFTGAKPSAATNFALLLIPYLGFFPAVVLFTVAAEPWIEAAWANVAWTAAVFAAAHLALHAMHRRQMHEHLLLIDADEDEEEFPQRLGLRY